MLLVTEPESCTENQAGGTGKKLGQSGCTGKQVQACVRRIRIRVEGHEEHRTWGTQAEH